MTPFCSAEGSAEVCGPLDGMPWKLDANEPTIMYGMPAASSAPSTATTASSGVTIDRERRDGSAALRPPPHGRIIELGVAMPHAICHEAAGSLEQTRSLEELVLRVHGPGPGHLVPEERVHHRSKRAHHGRF